MKSIDFSNFEHKSIGFNEFTKLTMTQKGDLIDYVGNLVDFDEKSAIFD